MAFSRDVTVRRFDMRISRQINHIACTSRWTCVAWPTKCHQPAEVHLMRGCRFLSFTAVASICFTVFSGPVAAQVPTFFGVVNPASDLPPGVPNYGIAQGSVFIVYGTNLSTGSLVQGTIPLGT